jgi:hypothetical protein
MTAKKTPDATPPRLPRFNPRDGYGLAYTVAGNPRLVALLPAEELAELVERHDRAVQIAAEAARVPIVQDDPAAKVREALASGEDVDVPALVTGMIEAKVAEVGRRDVLAFFASLASGPKQDIAALITDSEDALYAGLSEQLDAVLDEGQAALRELGGVRTADDAIDAGLGEQWQHLRAAAGEYADIRDSNLALLRVADSANFSPRSLGVGFAFFANLDAAEPAYTHIQQHGDTVRGSPASGSLRAWASRSTILATSATSSRRASDGTSWSR